MKSTRIRNWLIAGGASVLLILSAGREKEWAEEDLPSYVGLSATEWFDGAGSSLGIRDTVAFREMGTNAVPFLLSKAKAGTSVHERMYAWAYSNAPKVIQRRVKPPGDHIKVQMKALLLLGSVADFRYQNLADWAGEIVSLSREANHPLVRRKAAMIAGNVVRASGDVKLQRAVYTPLLDSPEFSIGLTAALEMARIDPSITNGVPTLVEAVTDSRRLGVPPEFASSREYVEHLIETDSELMRTSRFNGSQPLMTPRSWLDSVAALKLVAPEVAEQLGVSDVPYGE